MTRQDGLSQWVVTVSTHLAHLSKPQATVLGLWSFGMVMSKSCGLTSVAVFLAAVLGCQEDALRQRLREWYRDAADKKGAHRQTLEVRSCFAPLLAWVLSAWPRSEKRLALAMDATSLGQLFTVLAISVVYRGCAIPVAWVVLPGNTPGAWKAHWLSLFQQLHGSVPAAWTVLVLADRGLYAAWLYRQIVSLGWHPYLRINASGLFRPASEQTFRPLTTVVPSVGSAWSGRVTCFKSRPLPCTLLAAWAASYTDPWLILTDLAPAQADVCWYSLRAWIECGFKDTKRGGWQWQQTKITDPERAARLWLAIAVATLWVLSVGGEADANLPASTLTELPATHIARRRTTGRSQPRLLSCFRRGLLRILAAAIAGQVLPQGCFDPEPWPRSALPDTSGLFAWPAQARTEKTYP
jgi:hypothetical protein